MTRFSVIIPAYNAESTICRAIDSALMQHDVSTEIIVIDDASQDFTCNIIETRYAHNPRVVLLKNGANSGPAQARNTGIDHARGEWIAFLDADDWFAPGRLASLLSTARQHQLDMVADSYYLTQDLKSPPHATRFTRICQPGRLAHITVDRFIQQGLGSVKPIIRKSLLDRTAIRFDPKLFRGEDMLFFSTLLFKKSRFGLLNKPMYFRSESPNSLSRTDKIDLLLTLRSVFARLRRLTIGPISENSEIINALDYRDRVISDAIAAARFSHWLHNRQSTAIPGFSVILKTARHLLLREQRFHTRKLSV